MAGDLDGGQSLGNSNRTWVLGWLNFNGGTPDNANTNINFLTQYSPLAPYLGRDPGYFKCPSDTSLSQGRSGEPRVRSFAMNSYMGDRFGPFTPGYRIFRKTTEITDPAPARAFVFIDEREDSIN